jgi:hypothetical protein
VEECSFLPYWEDSSDRSTRPTRDPGEIQEDPERKEDPKKVQEFQKMEGDPERKIQGRYKEIQENSREIRDGRVEESLGWKIRRRYKKIHRSYRKSGGDRRTRKGTKEIWGRYRKSQGRSMEG